MPMLKQILNSLQFYLLGSRIKSRKRNLGYIFAFGDSNLDLFTKKEVFLLELFTEQIGLALINNELYGLSYRDSLTSLYVRRYLEERFEEEISRSIRTNRPFSFLLLDLDDFKKINDSHGHITGDKVLIEIGNLLRERLRDIDIPVRMGGEEFAILMPETPLAGAKIFAERLKERIELHSFPGSLKVTASFGLCQFETGYTFENMYRLCDTALYTAKKSGKNKVILHVNEGE